ncbi:uncharacterized protein F5891DRAFT_297043 [Suillus fuscotomentosus]|uniref:DUF6534 domain-containing protein n=1 Tax=Suillus fuscotomentosus TaxID=1912939 RepID=A0AAD4E6B4_9AGAM|nr:uncharacterized protein F5891DRAFT_297043 [Suillus fuscotomentosus]KAG1900533.1 hypothetical protein F5891DRAFT_297043 [Suillus fuscotomentosus]
MHIIERSANDFDARLIIGPVQVSGLLSAALFGCLSCQSCIYFAGCKSDHLALKAVVFAVFFIQLGHFVCIISTLWTMTVSTYGDPSQLQVLPLAADSAIPLSACTAFIVQSFYAFRLWKLSKKVYLPILCEMISLIAGIATLIISSRAFDMTDITIFEDSQTILIALSLMARTVCDVITTVAITWSLYHKRVSDFENTTTLIDRLIYWTVETGLATRYLAVS